MRRKFREPPRVWNSFSGCSDSTQPHVPGSIDLHHPVPRMLRPFRNPPRLCYNPDTAHNRSSPGYPPSSRACLCKSGHPVFRSVRHSAGRCGGARVPGGGDCSRLPEPTGGLASLWPLHLRRHFARSHARDDLRPRLSLESRRDHHHGGVALRARTARSRNAADVDRHRVCPGETRGATK